MLRYLLNLALSACLFLALAYALAVILLSVGPA